MRILRIYEVYLQEHKYREERARLAHQALADCNRDHIAGGAWRASACGTLCVGGGAQSLSMHALVCGSSRERGVSVVYRRLMTPKCLYRECL